MLDSLRKPPFFAALIVIGLAVLAELGSIAMLGTPSRTAAALDVSTPGKAIPALALLDGLVFYATLINSMPLLNLEPIQGGIQGIVTIVVSFFLLLGCIIAIYFNLALLAL